MATDKEQVVEFLDIVRGSLDKYVAGIDFEALSAAKRLIQQSEAAGGIFRGIDGDVRFDGPSPVLAANTEENMGILLETVSEAFDGRTPYRGRTLNGH